MIAALVPALRGIWKLASLTVTIPLWLIVAAWLVLRLDAFADQRAAVHRAVSDLVDGAELQAERAKVAALETLNAIEAQKALAAEQALADLSARAAESQRKLEDADDEIRELLARPVNDQCLVDADLFQRLRDD